MTTPLSVTLKRRRRALATGLLVATAGACGDDKVTAPAAPNALGVSGSGSDAGNPAPSIGPDAAGGTGGFGAALTEGGRANISLDPEVPNLPPGAACTPGASEPCSNDFLCSGVQTCGPDGTFGSCVCDTTGLSGGGVVGARCNDDVDCSGGGTCLRADSNIYLGSGGPAGGYCSFSCTRASATTADDCPTHDPQSFCAPLGPDGATYCIRTCFSLDPDPGEAKCLNRNDLVCVSRAAGGSEPFNGRRQDGYCAPQCGSDEDCPAGRVCHAQAGICTDAQVPGTGIGGSCTLDTECSGLACEDRNADDVGVCTAACTLGSLSGCGYGRDANPRKAGCLTPQVAAGRFSEGVGDLGFCRELCDVSEDCVQASLGWTCAPISAALQQFIGRSGACLPPN